MATFGPIRNLKHEKELRKLRQALAPYVPSGLDEACGAVWDVLAKKRQGATAVELLKAATLTAEKAVTTHDFLQEELGRDEVHNITRLIPIVGKKFAEMQKSRHAEDPVRWPFYKQERTYKNAAGRECAHTVLVYLRSDVPILRQLFYDEDLTAVREDMLRRFPVRDPTAAAPDEAGAEDALEMALRDEALAWELA
jgi:hypothetical protein